MCAQYLLRLSASELAEYIGVTSVDLLWREHIFPSYSAPIVMFRDHGMQLASARFGLEKTISIKSKMGVWERRERRFHNARGETIASKNSFKEHFKQQRCLVPLDAFIEFRGSKGAKERMVFAGVDSLPLMAAGIWGGDTEGGNASFSIVTSAAPESVLRAGHDRCPLFLDRGDWKRWIELAPLEGAVVRDLLERNISTQIVRI